MFDFDRQSDEYGRDGFVGVGWMLLENRYQPPELHHLIHIEDTLRDRPRCRRVDSVSCVSPASATSAGDNTANSLSNSSVSETFLALSRTLLASAMPVGTVPPACRSNARRSG